MITLENIINKIIEIDEKAISIKQKTEDMLESNEKELKSILADLENKIMNDANQEAEKQYTNIINEAKRKSEEIIVKGDTKYNKLENVFSEIKEELEEKIFNILFSGPT